MKINMYKIYDYKRKLQEELTFEEISKLYREILYDEYTKAKDYDVIHCYQLVRDTIDIFTQMTKGRKFDKNYLKDNIKRGVRMNLETINKWLDEEYGCSYTKLEELHDFYFEKYCDLKQENKQLKDNWNKLKEYIGTEWYSYDNDSVEFEVAKDILDKMEEMIGGDK